MRSLSQDDSFFQPYVLELRGGTVTVSYGDVLYRFLVASPVAHSWPLGLSVVCTETDILAAWRSEAGLNGISTLFAAAENWAQGLLYAGTTFYHRAMSSVLRGVLYIF